MDNDFSTTPIGNLGGNTATVITNDSLNGVANPVIGTDVSLTPGTAPTPAAGSIEMNTDGTITIAPGTTAGVYTYDYTICEIGNASNCDTATATVQVDIVDAVDINFSSTPIGNLGGNTVTVITNDSLNGAPNPAIGTDISLTPGTAPTPAAGSIAMNTDGTITIAPGTTAGSYTYDYTICEIGNTSNCDTATATLQVDAIDAMDDDLSATTVASASTAVENVLNVLDATGTGTEDTLNGVAVDTSTVTITASGVVPAELVFDPTDGSVDVAANAAWHLHL